jgi:hypothetical protein
LQEELAQRDADLKAARADQLAAEQASKREAAHAAELQARRTTISYLTTTLLSCVCICTHSQLHCNILMNCQKLR